MTVDQEDIYNHIRNGGAGFYEQKRGLIAVWGKEAIQFLDGLISNDMKTLEDGQPMLAAFPNAQGRLLAVVRVLRQGEKYLFETEEATREKVFQNLFRFTFAGDFFVEDLSDGHRYFELFGSEPGAVATGFLFESASSKGCFIETAIADAFRDKLTESGGVAITDDLYEIIRIESGIPKYGVDMDDTTIVPELGIDGLISYNKGCYIGQEIIARIHFRGHIAKRLTGLKFSEPDTMVSSILKGAELTTLEGKNAGRITSVIYSPRLNKNIAIAFVRYDYLTEGTELSVGGTMAIVAGLPFITS